MREHRSWRGRGPFSWFSSLRLGKKLWYLFFFIIALYLASLAPIYSVFVRDNLRDYAFEKNHTTLLTIQSNFDSRISRIGDMSLLLMTNDNIVQYLTSDSHIDAKDSKGPIQPMYELMNVFEGVSSVYIIRFDGQYVSATRNVTFLTPELLDDTQWSREIMEKAGGYLLRVNGNGLFMQRNGEDVITFIRVVNDLDTQKPIGMLAINLPISTLEQTYTDLKQKHNRIAYYSTDSAWLCGDDFTNELDGLLLPDVPYHQKVVGNFGNDQILSYYQIEDTPFTIVSSEYFYAGEIIPAEAGLLLGAMMVVTLFSMLLISAFLSFYITKPIHGLVSSMDAVAETGGFDKTQLSLPNDEIGHLESRYNRMLEEIDLLFKELILKERTLRKAEIAALQEQIKPHFLYNTLDAIAFLAAEESSEKAYEAITTLSSFFANFLSSGQTQIPIRTEIQITRDYLKLQKLRYGDIYEDEYDVDPDLEELIIPKLILQPLVENALYHGIRPKGEKGLIRISIHSIEDQLQIKVYDSGVGMTRNQIQTIMQKSESSQFGFKGTIERIRYFCEKEDVYSIRSVVDEFTEIVLTLPLENCTQAAEDNGNV